MQTVEKSHGLHGVIESDVQLVPAGLLTRFGQRFDEVVPVHMVQENVVLLVTATHDVIDRPPDIQRAIPAAWAQSAKVNRHCQAP